MSMSKKNYVAIAEITKNILQGSNFLIPMVNTLADYFARENNQFDKSIFRTACLNGKLKSDNQEMNVNVQDHAKITKKGPFNMLSNTDINRVDKILGKYDEAKAKMYKKNMEIAEKNRKKN